MRWRPYVGGTGERDALPPSFSAGREKADACVSELNLTPRTRNALLRGGVVTVSQLAETTDDQLLTLYKFGRKSLDEVREALWEWEGLPTYDRLRSDNRDLRTLVADLHELIAGCDGDGRSCADVCPYESCGADRGAGDCLFERRMRRLGVDV